MIEIREYIDTNGSVIDIPEHKNINYLGFLDDADKFNALAASLLLVIPSQYESLSMVTLEAYLKGSKPKTVNLNSPKNRKLLSEVA